jgi:hypothetical protein
MFRPGQVAALAALFDRVLGRREEVIGVGR